MQMNSRDLKAKLGTMVIDNPVMMLVVSFCLGAGIVLMIGLIV
jgi:hypothetical protein